MNMKILGLVLVGVITAIAFSVVSLSSELTFESELEPVSGIDFNYSELATIKEVLATQDIYMSSPAIISDYTVDQYCTFFDDDGKQVFMKYCSITALMDSDGKPLGNIHMGGNPDNPIMALAIIDASPDLDSRAAETDFVFQTMIETLVCDCWEERQPGDFETVGQWLDTAGELYDESGLITIKSNIKGLEQKQLILEITATPQSYLWTLIVVK